MKPIQWIRNFLLFLTLTLLLMGIINFIIDPFQQYRKAQFYKPIYDNERYLNPGLAKTYDYNEVIIGSSMTENFILSNAKDILNFTKPIKFCMSGTTAYEMKIMLDSAYKHQNIDAVIYGLDFFGFTGNTTRLFGGKGSIPNYLYDDSIFNDYRYLLSFDTFKFSLDSFITSKMPKHALMFDFNHMYQWQHDFSENDFNGTDRLKEWKTKNSFKKDYHNNSYSLEAMKKNVTVNLVPIVKNHPETVFYIFYPPYSILTFKDIKNQGWLNTLAQFKQYVFSELIQYPNVKIYDFQASKEVTCNLNNYRDMTHYHQKINTWMLQQMKNEQYLTKDFTMLQKLNQSLSQNIEECKF